MSARPDSPERQQSRTATTLRLVPYSPPAGSARHAERDRDGPGDGEYEEDNVCTHPTPELEFSSYDEDGNSRINLASEKEAERGRGRWRIRGRGPGRGAGSGVADVSEGPLATLGSTSSSHGPRAGSALEGIPASSSQPTQPNLASFAAHVQALNALSAAPPTRGRTPTTSYTTSTSRASQSSRQSFSSHVSESSSAATSTAPVPPTPTGQRRPTSRRRMVAVLNEDKTFSLVPQRGGGGGGRGSSSRDPEDRHSQQSQFTSPRSPSALSEYGSGPRASQLQFPATPARVSQASSHEGYSSYASSHYDRPASSLAGTNPDRSITPATDFPSSPGGSSTGETVREEHPVTGSSSSATTALPWNAYRMVGGLRKVPNFSSADPAAKQSAHSLTSDTTETPPTAASDAALPEPGHGAGEIQSRVQGQGHGDDVFLDTHPTPREQEPPSPRSVATSTGSERTNYRVYHDERSGSPGEGPSAQAQTRPELQNEPSDESLVDPHLRPQASFATAESASTDFDTTNYKVYTHSDHDEDNSDEGHTDSPTGVPSARALRPAPQLHPQASDASFQSVSSTASIGSDDNSNYQVYPHSSPIASLAPVPESEPIQDTNTPTRGLRPAQSFLSAVSSSEGNWRVYGRSVSPAALSSVESFAPPSPSGSFAPLLGSPSGPVPSLYTQEEKKEEEAEAEEEEEDDEEAEAGPSGAAATESNYVIYGDPTPDPSREPTPTTSGSGGTIVRHEQEESPQENLRSPLRSAVQRPFQEAFGYYRARSRSRSKSASQEDIKPKKSLKSVKSSISSVINEETAENYLAAQAYLDAPPGEYESISPTTTTTTVPGPSERQRQLDEQRIREQQQKEWAALAATPSAAAAGAAGSSHMALPSTPHQWSSQLSTVISESEPDSNGTHGSLRSVSLPGSHGSQEGRGSQDRRNSRGWSSSHSRQMLSISSSLAGELEASNSRSRSDSQPGSIERPSPAYRGFQGTVRDHDEDGDGLAELHQISPRPSRSRLSDLFTSSSNSSERNLHTSASNRSFNNNIPIWAKIYYGSGERKFLRGTSISSMSDLSSRPGSVIHHTHHSNSPVSEHFPLNIYSPRRRAREGVPEPGLQRRSTTGSMDIRPVTPPDGEHRDPASFRRSLRRMTSSIWSPHLRRDVRAQNRYSIWDAPSVAWSAESGMFGRRNLQVVLFVFGFIFPLSWMLGAVLPLPKPSPLAMVERDSSYSDLGVHSHNGHEYERHIETVDELRYANARWWRTLNRCMSVVGLLIIGAVVGLVIAAVKQGWGTSV